MRRLGTIAVFSLVLSVPLCAQRGGGGHGGGFGGGHAGGFSGGHVGGFASHAGAFGGSHVSSGRSFNGSPSLPSRGFARAPYSRASRSPYLHDDFRANRFSRFGGGRFHGDRFRRFGSRNNCYGYGCWWGYGYPGWYAGWWNPWWWNDNSDYDQDYYDNQAMAQQMNEQNLEEQRMLRQEEEDGDQDAYTPPRAPRPQPQPEQANQGAPIFPDTALVFRDQHKQDVQNYAIVGQTLWSFAPQHTQKIPLSELDLPATQKANEDRGVNFRVPTSNEAQ